MQPTIDNEGFKAVFRQHAAGVTVVTFAGRQRPMGFTATSLVSISAQPPMFAFSVAAGSSAWGELEHAESVVVQLLSCDQVDVAARFATPGIDRFAPDDWTTLPTGEPVLEGCVAWIRGMIRQRVSVGDAHVVMVEAAEHMVDADREVLVYRDRRYHRIAPIE